MLNTILAILIFASSAIGAGAAEPPETETLMEVSDTHTPPGSPNHLSDSGHVAMLKATIENLRLQITVLSQRVGQLLTERESLRLGNSTKSSQENYLRVLRRTMTAEDLDPDRCKIADILTGKVGCAPADQ